ncbi:MAG: hypothetical protein WD046_07070 [Paracoccaceae bacterium]
MQFFDFTIDIHGATIVVAGERLSTASLSPSEIDQQVIALKADLDRVAAKMKIAVEEQVRKPPFEDDADA